MSLHVIVTVMAIRQALNPDPESLQLAERMGSDDEVMMTIIAETLDSAKSGTIKEAGRTKCPGNGSVKGPLGRYPRSIDLAACPVSRGGTWHTHVTSSELTSPVNSLPDMANVVYGLTDVSIVAGVDTADVVVASGNRESMQMEFENAIGESVSGPRELYQVIKQRRINPTTARQRARKALDPLIFTVNTGYNSLKGEIGTIPQSNWAAPIMSGPNEAFAGQHAPAMWQPDSMDEAATKAEELISSTNLSGLVISTAVGTVVGTLVERIVFGD